MKFLVLVLLFCSTLAFSQVEAYRLYTSKGKKVSFEKMVKKLTDKEVILFGELHNNPIAHWMQLKLVQELHQQNAIALGAEMIEADDQKHLDLYLSDSINYTAFDSLARLWTNHKTDYQPLVDFAKENNIDFVAANIPRRFASLVYKNGFEKLESLTEAEKEWVASLPVPYDPELPGYKAMLTMMSDHANPNFPKAQAIKDATMAHFIVKHYEAHKKQLIHFNGAYHSQNYEGVYWYLQQYQPELTIGTITTVLQSDVTKLLDENKELADYILVVDEDMTTTY